MQLIGADTVEIRQTVDVAYDKIVNTMFDSLKQMAKMEGDEEDKGQLNYHVIIIGEFGCFRNSYSKGLIDVIRKYALLRRGGLPVEFRIRFNLPETCRNDLRREFERVHQDCLEAAFQQDHC